MHLHNQHNERNREPRLSTDEGAPRPWFANAPRLSGGRQRERLLIDLRKNIGQTYRDHCVSSWLRPFVFAEQQVAAWRFLGRQNWQRQDPSPKQTLDHITIGPKQR
ncbi:hypothetical protein [Roseiconus lacunae]|uniref:hypothetical protein n=1 Tax=Roseiconus lacunae TaxID=2605694 RepID=UPI00135C0163|nr:hypothetical protein [Roseiconus lacunae]